MARKVARNLARDDGEAARCERPGEARRTRLAHRGRVRPRNAQRADVAARIGLAALGMVLTAQAAGVGGGEVRMDERCGQRERRGEREARAQERPRGSTAIAGA